jgi:hypothetical protein
MMSLGGLAMSLIKAAAQGSAAALARAAGRGLGDERPHVDVADLLAGSALDAGSTLLPIAL